MAILARLFGSSSRAPWELFEAGKTTWATMSSADKEAVVNHYAPKIRFLAQRLKKKLPRFVDLNELLSCGTLGLIESLGKFKPELGIRFETYAETRISGAMLDGLRRQDWFTRSMRQKIRCIYNAQVAIEHDKCREATEEELVKATGLSLKEVRKGLEAMHGQEQLPLDTFKDSLSNDALESGGSPLSQAMQNELAKRLLPLFNKLTERERLVLSLYYNEELTMSEIADILKITEGRVSQLRSQGLKRLRSLFVSTYR